MFTSKHSCKAQLFLTTDDLTKAIDVMVQVDMAILDFSKAIDKVAHNRLNINWTSMEFVAIYVLGWL